MRDIIRLHRSIVEESMLPPSDPLEARLHREIIELTERTDRGETRAAQELKYMQAFLDEYNDVKDGIDRRDRMGYTRNNSPYPRK